MREENDFFLNVTAQASMFFSYNMVLAPISYPEETNPINFFVNRPSSDVSCYEREMSTICVAPHAAFLVSQAGLTRFQMSTDTTRLVMSPPHTWRTTVPSPSPTPKRFERMSTSPPKSRSAYSFSGWGGSLAWVHTYSHSFSRAFSAILSAGSKMVLFPLTPQSRMKHMLAKTRFQTILSRVKFFSSDV